MKQSLVARVAVALGGAFIFATACFAAGLPPDKYTEWTSDDELFVPMKDGIHLSTDVLLPKGATGKLPTILIRTPYYGEKTAPLGDMRQLWLRQGYAVVVQNERGLVLSEGTYRTYLQDAKSDGNDTLNWIVKQPWSDGKIATIGCSSSGDTQPLVAANNNPALLATVPAGTWPWGAFLETIRRPFIIVAASLTRGSGCVGTASSRPASEWCCRPIPRRRSACA